MVGDRSSKSRLTSTSITESQFAADDAALYTISRQHLTTMATEFVGRASEWGLTVSIPKTKAMVVNGSQLTSDVVLPGGASVEMVPEFQYLGEVVSGDGTLDWETSSRVSKASCAFGCLQGSIFQCHALSIAVK